MTRVLVVEDNENLRRGLCDMLENDGYEAIGAADGPTALDRLRESSPDLVVLDLMLPGMNGARVLREIRAAGSGVIILVLTAKSDEDDKVSLLHAGADDYVTKPFGRRELSARINALLRRVHAPLSGEASILRFGDVVIDTHRRVVSRGGQPVLLAFKEFDLLLALALRKGGVATRAELLREVWHYEADVASRTVDLHVLQLRKKLEDDARDPKLIVTVWKVGYRLAGFT
jgi:two-component system response regulator MtrA